MKRPLFALLGVFVLVGAAVGPAVAATTQAANDSDDAMVAGNAPVENATFGQEVSAFVHALQQSSNDTGIGQAVSSFVVANNPGNAPAFAGGPGGPNATQNESTRGPPENATGPPAHAGGPDDGNETASDRRGPPGDGDGGPPAHAGPKGNSGNGQGPGGPDADEESTPEDDV